MRKWSILFLLCCGLLLILAGCQQGASSIEKSAVNSAAKSTSPSTSLADGTRGITNTSAKAKAQASQQIDWTKPSGGTYPTLAKAQKIWIDLSVSKQRVYIKDGNTTLYTMVMSSGLNTSPDDSTPLGTYYVQPERGKWFYSAKVKEGAEYWVSWKNHGEFLFHSVPMDKDQNVIVSEAKKLGHPASHGCLRLTIPDAKWIYQHIQLGTKVVIHK